MTKRNEPCPCGSGKKFKKCCISLQKDVEGLVHCYNSDGRLVGKNDPSRLIAHCNCGYWTDRLKQLSRPAGSRDAHCPTCGSPALFMTYESWKSQLDESPVLTPEIMQAVLTNPEVCNCISDAREVRLHGTNGNEIVPQLNTTAAPGYENHDAEGISGDTPAGEEEKEEGCS